MKMRIKDWFNYILNLRIKQSVTFRSIEIANTDRMVHESLMWNHRETNTENMQDAYFVGWMFGIEYPFFFFFFLVFIDRKLAAQCRQQHKHILSVSTCTVCHIPEMVIRSCNFAKLFLKEQSNKTHHLLPVITSSQYVLWHCLLILSLLSDFIPFMRTHSLPDQSFDGNQWIIPYFIFHLCSV